MDDVIDYELADARAELVSKLYGLIHNLTVRAGSLDAASLKEAADFVPMMTGPVEEIETAVRRFDNLLRSPADGTGRIRALYGFRVSGWFGTAPRISTRVQLRSRRQNAR